MNYKRIDHEDIAFFYSVCGTDRVILGKDINEDYSRDEMTPLELRKFPDVLIKVRSTEEVSKILKYANDKLIPVTTRGQGTGLVGGCVPLYGGILLDTTLMNRIIELDKENLTMTVEAGVLIMEIRNFAEANQLFYAPMPGELTATIGGNVSTNAGGIKALKYGVTREWILGLEFVLPNGDIINHGGKIAKNSSGYSLKDFIIGSEGTLGVVTKVIVKLIPLPKKAMSLLVPFPNMDLAIEIVPKIIMESKIIPTSLEFMEKEVILDAENYLGKKFPDHSANAYLLLNFDGNSMSQLESEYEVVAQICLKYGAIDVFISDTPEREESIWSARKAFLEAIKGSTSDMDECDVVVPRSNIPAFLKYTLELRKKYNIQIKSFAHVGDGNLHIYPLKDDLKDEEWKQKIDAVMEDLYAKAKELGGQISGEHGIGFIKKKNLERFLGEDSPNIQVMRNVKKAFDPNNILNPGKIF